MKKFFVLFATLFFGLNLAFADGGTISITVEPSHLDLQQALVHFETEFGTFQISSIELKKIFSSFSEQETYHPVHLISAPAGYDAYVISYKTNYILIIDCHCE